MDVYTHEAQDHMNVALASCSSLAPADLAPSGCTGTLPTKPGRTPPSNGSWELIPFKHNYLQASSPGKYMPLPQMYIFLFVNLHIWDEVWVPNSGASKFNPPTTTQNVAPLVPAPGKVSLIHKGKNPSFTARQALLYWWARSLLKGVSQICFVQVSSQSQAHQGEETFMHPLQRRVQILQLNMFV